MNPFSVGKMMNAKKVFEKNHPKFAAFVSHVLTGGIPEGTVIEVTVTKPGQTSVTANLKVLPSDLELLESLKKM